MSKGILIFGNEMLKMQVVQRNPLQGSLCPPGLCSSCRTPSSPQTEHSTVHRGPAGPSKVHSAFQCPPLPRAAVLSSGLGPQPSRTSLHPISPPFPILQGTRLSLGPASTLQAETSAFRWHTFALQSPICSPGLLPRTLTDHIAPVGAGWRGHRAGSMGRAPLGVEDWRTQLVFPNPLGPGDPPWDLGLILCTWKPEAPQGPPWQGVAPGYPPHPPRAFCGGISPESGAQPSLNLTST